MLKKIFFSFAVVGDRVMLIAVVQRNDSCAYVLVTEVLMVH